MYANQKTQVHHQNIKEDNQILAKYQVTHLEIYAVMSRGNFCREFLHYFGLLFEGLKNMVACQK